MDSQKRQNIVSMRIDEVSTVDRPAQAGAVAVLIKSAGDQADVAIRKNAEAVAGGAQVVYKAADFDAAMLRLADELAVERGITPERALLTSLSTDPGMMNLAHASSVARAIEYGAAVRKRFGDAA
jgi:hypothetical protein